MSNYKCLIVPTVETEGSLQFWARPIGECLPEPEGVSSCDEYSCFEFPKWTVECEGEFPQIVRSVLLKEATLDMVEDRLMYVGQPNVYSDEERVHVWWIRLLEDDFNSLLDFNEALGPPRYLTGLGYEIGMCQPYWEGTQMLGYSDLWAKMMVERKFRLEGSSDPSMMTL